jgi:hypothetical protein
MDTPQMTGPFKSSKRWITQAREDIQDFKERERAAFTGKQAYTVFTDLKRRPGHKVVGLKPAKLSDTLTTKAANIVGALRNALDQATWRASVELGASEEEIIYFPFGGTKGNFDNLFRGKGKAMNIPHELHGKLKGFEGFPTSKDYSGGNNLLYALSKISNPNKHTETYTVGLAVAQRGHMMSVGDMTEGSFPPKYDPVNNEIVLFTTPAAGKLNIDMSVATFVAFGEVPIVARQPVIPVLDEMTSVADRIVLGIEAETARILRERNV